MVSSSVLKARLSSGEGRVLPAIRSPTVTGAIIPQARTGTVKNRLIDNTKRGGACSGHRLDRIRRVTRFWFLRRFTAVAFLWRPTFAWTVDVPGRRTNCDQLATFNTELSS